MFNRYFSLSLSLFFYIFPLLLLFANFRYISPLLASFTLIVTFVSLVYFLLTHGRNSPQEHIGVALQLSEKGKQFSK